MFKLVSVYIERGLLNLNKPFTYAYFKNQEIGVGFRVKVKFANSLVIGFVSKIEDINEDFKIYQSRLPYKINEIEEIIDNRPILNEELLKLAEVVSKYYFAPLIDVLKAMLPPSLKPDTTSLNKPKVLLKKYIVFNNENEIKLNNLQKNLLDKIKMEPILKSKITSKKTLEFLLANNLVKEIEKQEFRAPIIEENVHNVVLNNSQELALKTILESNKDIFLLQGVTGSGKTEVYIALVKKMLKENKSSLILVPEISLTDSLVSKLKYIFKDEVALIHSGLSNSQKYDEYLRIASNMAHVVVGTRSSIFAPVKNLGLIIIDEEHVESYKQDVSPYYDARKVAEFRIKQAGAKLVLGSATPRLESKARAQKGIYQLVLLSERFNKNPLPLVELVDLSDYNNIDYHSSLISFPLQEKLKETFNKHEQAILLLNRRGYSPVYICRKCQRILKCPNCNIPLTYHKNDKEIKCHHCDYVLSTNELVCPSCGSHDFTFSGFGTERIQEDLKSLFPKINICRLDFDTTRKKNSYHQILQDFNNGKYDLMIGTQMVAKGHDFPNVTLAVSLLADQSLEFPSYKSNEDTFDLLTQLVGRAGRKEKLGTALIQTYDINNPVINFALTQDYEGFYKFEMENRKARKYPPYTYLINIHLSSESKDKVIEAAYKVKNFFVSKIKNNNYKCEIFGPAIPYIEKLANRYYRVLMLKYKDRKLIEDMMEELLKINLSAGSVKLSIDVDPSSNI